MGHALRRVGVDEADVDDLSQEVFVVLLRNMRETTCGDGVVDPGEECDGFDLFDPLQACVGGQQMECTDECTYVATSCCLGIGSFCTSEDVCCGAFGYSGVCSFVGFGPLECTL
ncbi:MAG: hypothetical protein AB1Z98_39260 [Nannocystaceae bacterium]